jgi:hypothetical protein
LRGEGKFLALPSSEPVFGATLEFCSTEQPGEASTQELLQGAIMLNEFCRSGREHAENLCEYRRSLTNLPFISDVRRYLRACEQYFSGEDPYCVTEPDHTFGENMKTSVEKEIDEWLAIRKEEGRKIDPETAEANLLYVVDLDPYGVDDLTEEDYEYCSSSKEWFVRNPGSDIWVWVGDVPDEKWERIQKRRRERSLESRHDQRPEECTS